MGETQVKHGLFCPCYEDVRYMNHFPGVHIMMTSSNGNIFREFTGPGEFPTQWPVTRSFDVFFDLRLNKRLSKQPWGWWFETPSWSLWRHCNDLDHSASVCFPWYLSHANAPVEYQYAVFARASKKVDFVSLCCSVPRMASLGTIDRQVNGEVMSLTLAAYRVSDDLEIKPLMNVTQSLYGPQTFHVDPHGCYKHAIYRG